MYGVGDEPRRDETEVEGVADRVWAISCHGEGCRAMFSASCGNGRKGCGGVDSLGRSFVIATGDMLYSLLEQSVLSDWVLWLVLYWYCVLDWRWPGMIYLG